MRKLISNLFFLGLITAATIAIIVMISPHDTNNYLAAAIDKHRLLYSVESPRIILVGGSNIAFSVDSQKLEKRFGIPVINMGLHAGLGLNFMLNEVKPALKSEDIVVIFPEYEHFYSLPLDGRPLELGTVVKFCRECISVITIEQLPISIRGILQLTENDILHIRASKDIYVRQGFNQWGDMVFHLDQADRKILANHILPIKIISPNPAVDALNSFYKSAAQNKVRVFLMFPAIPIIEYNAQKEDFSTLNDFLHAELDIPLLGNPQDFIYPKKMFYDTVYHMNRTGRDNRTNRIIDLLTPLLQND